MDVYQSESYRELIKDRLRSLKTKKTSWTFKKIAEHLGLQATYLSKVMNSKNFHLSEDSLYGICKVLRFHPKEIDYILLLRSMETAQNLDRKREIKVKVERLRSEQELDVDVRKSSSEVFSNELEYLLDPICVLLHVSLMSENLRKDVRQLGAKLGLKTQQLKAYLKTLERNNLIKLDPHDSWVVLKVETWRTHFHRDHPLVRVSQNLLRQQSLSRLSQIDEEEKHSLNFTFTFDSDGFEALKKEFQSFLKKAESLSKISRHTEVYQMNFDLFKWL